MGTGRHVLRGGPCHSATRAKVVVAARSPCEGPPRPGRARAARSAWLVLASLSTGREKGGRRGGQRIGIFPRPARPCPVDIAVLLLSTNKSRAGIFCPPRPALPLTCRAAAPPGESKGQAKQGVGVFSRPASEYSEYSARPAPPRPAPPRPAPPRHASLVDLKHLQVDEVELADEGVAQAGAHCRRGRRGEERAGRMAGGVSFCRQGAGGGAGRREASAGGVSGRCQLSSGGGVTGRPAGGEVRSAVEAKAGRPQGREPPPQAVAVDLAG